MPKKVTQPLAAVQIPELRPGFHPEGTVTGLYLRATAMGAKSWILRIVINGNRRDMGLGGYPAVTLADARKAARKAREAVAGGADPVTERQTRRRACKAIPSFQWCAEQTIAAKRPEWKSAKHAAQWTSTLAADAYPILGKIPVDQIELSHVLEVLAPIWTVKNESATRLRARLEAVLAWATASGYRKGDNPARWKGNLDAVLAKPSKVAKVSHHKALPIDEMHSFVASLRLQQGMAARALEFLILTAARSGEVRGATWQEIDLNGAVWKVPAERMKASKEHRVPLSARAIALLKALPRMAGSELVFPAPRGGRLSDMTISAVMRRMRVDAVPHGFRSTFRDWCSERTGYPRDVAEMALAHTISNKVEAAYRRGDLFVKRVHLMNDWESFINLPPANSEVIALRRNKA
ncbi:TPA: tyrosine-type recombinase/integrase [Stenotrophomonas maltophilia]|uniref:tyrosine-type recombinase/integrase n=1 Tax=Stenotrophomonas TaxID=40323 RepID=UPI00155916B2|nr:MULTISPECIES: site-specific integrase [Stenotrophomonas]MBA0352536.1 site-specific integrase [Stenotrophomonas maltophilia]MBN5108034.1 integrase arm-type DNA-binding domain-containing protein [Stenotrophomonas maltophilia]MDH0550546.1 integrase arm-type DNA-binding domain-containing protein [Stenotrophomonas sp. GD04006]